MLQRIREGLTLVLIAVLPLHALLVTVGTKIIAGPGNSPLPMLAIWKEGVLGVILIVAAVEWAGKLRMKNEELRMDVLDLCIVSLFLWSLVQSFILHSSFFILHYAFGFKYDFLPLIAFVLLRRVQWSSSFIRTAGAVLLGVGCIVALYGIIVMFLPMSWFTVLGYSDLHSLYVPGGPLAPFQQIESISIRRMQSTFSGPNQLGLWLLIPVSMLLTTLSSKKVNGYGLRVTSFILMFIAIALSFSRAAWIAAAVISGVALWKYLPKGTRVVAGSAFLGAGIVIVASVLILAPDVVLRAASSTGHIERPLQALQMMKEHPWGLGLGTAGPASNRFSDTCIDLPAGSDATWATPHTNLCVFVGGEQAQPNDRACACPVLPENWYLQIGVELGWIGFALYLVLVVRLLQRLMKLRMKNEELKMTFFILHSSFFIFLGISIAALFLHAWEDSAVAYTVWILLAVVLTPQQKRPLNP